MNEHHTLSEPERLQLRGALTTALAAHAEVRFAVLYGSFSEALPFRDIDIAVRFEAGPTAPDPATRAVRLGATLQRLTRHPLDVRDIDALPLSVQYHVTRGTMLVARDEEEWASFRERVWLEYLDFAPLARETLLDLLD